MLKFNNSNNNLGDVYYALSSNYGNSFTKEQDLNPESEFGAFASNDGHPTKSTMPVVKFDSQDRVYIAWAELHDQWGVYFKFSDDLGNHWSQKLSINDQDDNTNQPQKIGKKLQEEIEKANIVDTEFELFQDHDQNSKSD